MKEFLQIETAIHAELIPGARGIVPSRIGRQWLGGSFTTDDPALIAACFGLPHELPLVVPYGRSSKRLFARIMSVTQNRDHSASVSFVEARPSEEMG